MVTQCQSDGKSGCFRLLWPLSSCFSELNELGTSQGRKKRVGTYVFMAGCPTWAETLFRLSCRRLPNPSFYRRECLKELWFLRGKKNVCLGERWRRKMRKREGEVIISFCLFCPPAPRNAHTVSIGQKGWSRARNPRVWFASMGGFKIPDDKHSTGLVCLPISTLLQKSTRLFHSDSGQPYAKCIILKTYMH